jgi:putative MATE family efflux protein
MAVGFFLPRQIIGLFNNEPQIMEAGVRYLQIVLASYLFTGITFVYNFAFRSIGNALQPMVISTIALICNAFFNYVLIFGKFGAPAMGVAGAALATVIARVVENIALLVSVYYRRGVLSASLRELTDLDFGFIKKAYQTIIPVLFNDICWALANMIYAVVFGRMGSQAVATIQIVNTITNLFMVVFFGMSNATAVMVGNSIGAGAERQTREYARRFAVLSIVMGVGLGLLLAVTSPYLLNVFNVSRTVQNHAQIILLFVAFVFLIGGVLRGGGDARAAFLYEGFTMWFIGVPLTIIGAFYFKLPVYLVYGLSLVEEITKALLCLGRLRSGRWIHNVSHSLS